jgi:DNA repair photolyase
MIRVGVTERGDASLDTSWRRWVSLGKPAILITKDIGTLLNDNPLLLQQPNVIVHATVTGYGGSFIEPNAPDPQSVLSALSSVPESLRSRIVVRVDPIIPLNECVHMSKSVYDATREMGYTRHRVSILDLYPHVLKRFDKYVTFKKDLKDAYGWDLSHSLGEHKDYMSHAPLDRRKRVLSIFPTAEVCGEPGVRCRGCVSARDLELFGIREEQSIPNEKQRPWCMCLASKTELLSSKTRCAFECEYCYWHDSR